MPESSHTPVGPGHDALSRPVREHAAVGIHGGCDQDAAAPSIRQRLDVPTGSNSASGVEGQAGCEGADALTDCRRCWARSCPHRGDIEDDHPGTVGLHRHGNPIAFAGAVAAEFALTEVQAKHDRAGGHAVGECRDVFWVSTRLRCCDPGHLGESSGQRSQWCPPRFVRVRRPANINQNAFESEPQKSNEAIHLNAATTDGIEVRDVEAGKSQALKVAGKFLRIAIAEADPFVSRTVSGNRMDGSSVGKIHDADKPTRHLGIEIADQSLSLRGEREKSDSTLTMA